MRGRRKGTEKEAAAEDEEGEKGSGGVSRLLLNINIETAGAEEEAAEGLAVVLRMEVEEDEGREGE